MAPRDYEPAEAATATYRPLHPFAIPSLALAAGGLIGIWWTLAAIASIFALALAIVAFAQIVRRPDDYSGKLWAGLAIALAAFTIGFAPVRNGFEQSYLFGGARRAADQWLDLLAEDRLYEAHQLTLPATERQPADADLEEYYSQPLSAEEKSRLEKESFGPALGPKETLENYAKLDLVEKALASDSFEWTFRGRLRQSENAMDHERYFDLWYDLSFDGGQDPVRALVRVERKEIPGQRIAAWRILSFERPTE